MIDPKYMDEQLGVDRTKIAERYKQINSPENAPQEDGIMFREEGEAFDATSYEEVDESAAVRKWEEEKAKRAQKEQAKVAPPKIARPGKAFAEDKALFPGGPLESEILAWKKQFGKVFSTTLDGSTYIWRTINRFEYKEVTAMPNSNEYTREEMLCEVCVLFPYEYTFETMINGPGGIPSMLAEQIMQKSGFTRQAKVIQL